MLIDSFLKRKETPTYSPEYLRIASIKLVLSSDWNMCKRLKPLFEITKPLVASDTFLTKIIYYFIHI